MTDGCLPEGVEVRRLITHGDERGELRELFRASWVPSGAFLQWNLVRSEGRVLRGVHVHPRHADYLYVIEGEMLLGLHDLRPEDPEQRVSTMLRLSDDAPSTVYVPPGVCHGFWFERPTLYVYGLSVGWSPDEELGCRYDAPELGLDWPTEGPILSPRDRAPATTYAEMREAWLATQVPA